MEYLKSLILLITMSPSVAFATSILDDPTGDPYDSADDLSALVDRLQDIVLAVAAVVAMVMIIWGAFTLLTAGGNEERVAKGKKILTFTIIGILLLTFSYGIITLFVELLGGDVL